MKRFVLALLTAVFFISVLPVKASSLLEPKIYYDYEYDWVYYADAIPIGESRRFMAQCTVTKHEYFAGFCIAEESKVYYATELLFSEDTLVESFLMCDVCDFAITGKRSGEMVVTAKFCLDNGEELMLEKPVTIGDLTLDEFDFLQKETLADSFEGMIERLEE